MILTFVFDNRIAVTVAVNTTKKCVNLNEGRGDFAVGKCTVNTKTTYDVTERWYDISYLCVS